MSDTKTFSYITIPDISIILKAPFVKRVSDAPDLLVLIIHLPSPMQNTKKLFYRLCPDNANRVHNANVKRQKCGILFHASYHHNETK